MSATIVHRGGRTFKVDRGRSGDVTGWIVFVRDEEPGITWTVVSGAHRLKGDAYADIDRMTA